MGNESKSRLAELFCSALEGLLSTIEQDLNGKKLLGIGVVTADDVPGIAAFFLFEGDLLGEVEPYQRYSAVEWLRSTDGCFVSLNEELEKHAAERRETDWEGLVRDLFEFCAVAFEKTLPRKRFGDDVFISFASTDPCDFMVYQESQFVRRMNPPEVFSEWEAEFAK